MVEAVQFSKLDQIGVLCSKQKIARCFHLCRRQGAMKSRYLSFHQHAMQAACIGRTMKAIKWDKVRDICEAVDSALDSYWEAEESMFFLRVVNKVSHKSFHFASRRTQSSFTHDMPVSLPCAGCAFAESHGSSIATHLLFATGDTGQVELLDLLVLIVLVHLPWKQIKFIILFSWTDLRESGVFRTGMCFGPLNSQFPFEIKHSSDIFRTQLWKSSGNPSCWDIPAMSNDAFSYLASLVIGIDFFNGQRWNCLVDPPWSAHLCWLILLLEV